MKKFLRRPWLVMGVVVVAAAASVFAMTALAGPGGNGGGTVTYTAAPGEANNITVTQVGAGDIHIQDAGRTVSLRQDNQNCTIFSTDTLDCPVPNGATLTISGSDGADQIVIDSSVTTSSGLAGIVLDGGPGNDPLLENVSSVPTTFIGGPGDDFIVGHATTTDTVSYAQAPNGVNVNLRTGVATGDGTDTLFSGFGVFGLHNVVGSAHDDTIEGDSGDNDLAGGGGTDTVSYSGAPGSVNVVLNTSATGDGTDTLSGFANVIGSASGDTIVGDGNANRLDGGAGNDNINGGLGNDTLSGGPDDDTLNGGGGQNTVDYSAAANPVSASLASGAATGDGSDVLTNFVNLIGSAGNDTLTGDSLANVISGGAGDDVIDGAGAADTLSGGPGDDAVSGGSGNDSVAGDDGSDTLVGGGGDDSLDGGAGLDTASFAGGAAVSVSLATGVATGQGIDSLSGLENLTGSANNDALTGDAGNNTLDGGLGDDTLDGAAGNDSLVGGGGVDTVDYSGSAQPVSVTLGAPGSATGQGSDSLSSISNLVGSNGDDTLVGDNGNNTLSGGAGNDGLAGGGGNDVLNGGNGDDTAAQTGAGSTIENGGAGNDRLSSSDNPVSSGTLNGGDGGDVLQGGAGVDQVAGGAGDDTLSGGSGVNTLDGGSGSDTLDYSGALSVPIASLGGGFALTVYSSGVGSDSLANLENVTGSPGADTFIGDANENVFRGLGGDDFIRPAGGDDSVQGGSGNDTVDFLDSPGGVNVNLATQTALGFGTVALSSIENVNGSGSADQLLGNGGPNVIQGAGGNDQIDGGGGADTLDGGANDDTIYAKDGIVDTILCGAGNDSATVDPIDTVNADCEAAGFLGGPVVRTIEATGITTTGATLNGGVNTDGRPVTFSFRYGPTTAYGSTTAPGTLPAAHSEALVSAAISGLTQATAYHFQLVVTDGLGNTTLGNDQVFTTAGPPGPSHPGPLAETLSPAQLDPVGAMLLGRVTTNGARVVYYFEYGPTTSYGAQTPAQELGATSTPVQVFFPIQVKPNTTYHYRLVATNEFGTSFGADRSFTAPKGTTASNRTLRRATRLGRSILIRPR